MRPSRATPLVLVIGIATTGTVVRALPPLSPGDIFLWVWLTSPFGFLALVSLGQALSPRATLIAAGALAAVNVAVDRAIAHDPSSTASLALFVLPLYLVPAVIALAVVSTLARNARARHRRSSARMA